MCMICTTQGFVLLSKRGGRVYLASCILAWVCSPIRSTFLSEHAFYVSQGAASVQPGASAWLQNLHTTESRAAAFSVLLAAD